jgi:hypothetical protein
MAAASVIYMIPRTHAFSRTKVAIFKISVPFDAIAFLFSRAFAGFARNIPFIVLHDGD